MQIPCARATWSGYEQAIMAVGIDRNGIDKMKVSGQTVFQDKRREEEQGGL